MSKNSGNKGDSNANKSQPEKLPPKLPIQQYDEGDTDTDDENNTSSINERQGGGTVGSGGNNAQTLKKEVKNYKKCRKMFFFLTAMVIFSKFKFLGSCMPDQKIKGDKEQLSG